MNTYIHMTTRRALARHAQSTVLQPSLFHPFSNTDGGPTSHQSGRLEFSRVFMFNVFLAAAAAVLLVFYIVHINGISADTYRLSQLNGRLAALNEATSTLTAGVPAVQDPSLLVEFAAGHNLVPAGDIVHLFENGAVALNRNR